METPIKQMQLISHDIYEIDPVQLELDQYIQSEAHAFYSNGALHYRPGMRLPSLSRSPSPRTHPGEILIPPEIQKRLDLIPVLPLVLASAKKTQKRHWYDSREASLADTPLLAIEEKKEGEGDIMEVEVPIPDTIEESETKVSDDNITVHSEVLPEKNGLAPHEQRTQDKISAATTSYDERRQKMFLLMNEQNSLGNMPVNKSEYMGGEKLQHNTEYQEYMKHYEYSQKQMMMDKRDDERRLVAIERQIKKGLIAAENTPIIPQANSPIPTAQRNDEMRQRLEDISREKEFLLEEDEEWRDTEDAVKRVRAKLLLENQTPTLIEDVPKLQLEE